MKTNNKILALALAVGLIIVLKSCSAIPKNAKAVNNFDAKKYMGVWYEIARFDFRFEKNLNNVLIML